MAKRLMIGLLLWLVPVTAGAQSAAQRANPGLTAHANGVRDAAHDRALALRRFEVEVAIRGAVTETTITASFDNPGKDILEGDFSLAMPAGAVVTGYALDVEGQMIDGVLVDRPKAKAVYEARVRQRVDPGLAEIVDGAFHTRVFPIPPGGGRKIRLRFTAPMTGAEGYAFPLRIDAPRDGWSLNVRWSGVTTAPVLSWPGSTADFAPRRDGASTAIASGTGALNGVFRIAPPVLPAIVASRNAQGERYLQLSGDVGATTAAVQGERVRILWDRSRSRLGDDHDAELALLRSTLAALKPEAIEIVTFNSSGAESTSVANADAAIERLRPVRYRGATSFAPLAGIAEPADRCLLFSNGKPSIDRATAIAVRCRLDAVTAGASADMAWLRHLAANHGGRAFALAGDQAAVVQALTVGAPGVTALLDDDGARLPFVPLDSVAGRWTVIARAPTTGGVRMQIGAAESRHAVPDADGDFDGEGALIAADQLATLGATEQRSDYVALSRRYGIASPSLSFVVLETPADYIAADIAPPAGYPAERRDDYLRTRKQRDGEIAAARRQHLDTLVAGWTEQVAWWKRRFDPKARPKRNMGEESTSDEEPMAPPPPPPPPPSPAPVAAPAPMESASADAGIIVTGNRQPGERPTPVSASARAGPTIAIDAWQPDRPYLKAFDRAPADFDARFAETERRDGGIPAFYLDTAEWLRRHGRTQEAIEMVLAALDLPSANEVTLGIVADRLERYGALDRAVELRERQAALDPTRPQPKRLLALALAKRAALQPASARGDLERSLALLSDVALTPWNSAWDGIDLIALMEANALIPKLRQLGGRIELDQRLIALLDADIRIVVDWTTDATDLDLWVDEPSGERAIYNNPRTAIGGHLSNDMTSGYGPEEYFLRRAPGGTYVVQANVYAPDRIDPNGPSLITARLIRDFGRPTEHEESVDIELKSDDRGEKMIGRIVVPGAPGGKR